MKYKRIFPFSKMKEQKRKLRFEVRNNFSIVVGMKIFFPFVSKLNDGYGLELIDWCSIDVKLKINGKLNCLCLI